MIKLNLRCLNSSTWTNASIRTIDNSINKRIQVVFYTTNKEVVQNKNNPVKEETKALYKKEKSSYYYETIYEGPINNTMKGFKYIGNSLFLVAFFSSPAIYFYGKAPVLGSFFVALCGIIPSYYTYIQTNSYVSLAQLRQSGSRNKRNITGETIMKLETLGLFGQKANSLVKLEDCQVMNHWLLPANLLAKRTIIAEKNGEFIYGSQKKFFFEKGRLENNPMTAGLWALWKANSIQKQK